MNTTIALTERVPDSTAKLNAGVNFQVERRICAYAGLVGYATA